MTTARSTLINLELTPFYLCSSVCVRRTFIYGNHRHSGKNYSVRKAWILTRMRQLTTLFSIRICAFAILNSEYHLVLHIDKKEAKKWSQTEVQKRWGNLFSRDVKFLKLLSKEQQRRKIALWRERLSNISWFMRCLNESVAHFVNGIEGRRGRFWDGRFKSQPLYEEKILLKKLEFIDLHPQYVSDNHMSNRVNPTFIYHHIQRLSSTIDQRGAFLSIG